MQYADGYVAYLNGVEIASENAPASPTWNSLANEEQTSDVQATTYEDIDVSSFLNAATTGHITTTGTNVLAVQVLLHSNSDTDMLAVPELGQITSAVAGDFIYSTPSPGAANTASDVQASITFSSTHGLYYAPVQVALTPNVAGQSIYYTTNNAAPGVQQAVSNITHSGTTATVTTSSAVGFATGDVVTIAGATPAVYDGAFAITVTGTNTFTYTLPTTPAANAGDQQAISSITYSGTTATATTSVASGFSTDETVTITGVTPSAYDGTFTVTATGTNTFTYTMDSTPSANASGTSMTATTSITATAGTLYTVPINVSTTTVLQAAMVVGSVAAPYQTQTYVFPDAVATQSNTAVEAAGFPADLDRQCRRPGHGHGRLRHVVGPQLHDGADRQRAGVAARDVFGDQQRQHVRPRRHLRQL